MEEILRTKALTKNYGRIKAVDSLDLSIERGMVYGILGPNGSGKTTTLGMVLDVINKTSGEYFWFGGPPTKASRRKIGAILETPVFYPYLSGQRNLEIIAEIKQASRESISAVLKQVGLWERKDDHFRTYSLGMKQRLSIAAALVNDPLVLILDEPTNGLDPQGIAEIRQLIRDIATSGKTILLASHLLDEVQKVCSHFGILRRGKLLHSGRVEDVSKQSVAIEVSAEHPDLEKVLSKWDAIEKMTLEKDKLILIMQNGVGSQEVNQYLFQYGIIASHLLTQRKSLEKQFLEILNEQS